MNSTSCAFCGREDKFNINGPQWTGTEYIRINYCGGCARNIISAPRRPRAKRVVVATDYNMLCAAMTRKGTK